MIPSFDEKAQAKNIKQAKAGLWIGPFAFVLGVLALYMELPFWQHKASLIHVFHIGTYCGMILVGAFLRADSKEVLRRGGEAYKSWGSYLSYLLITISQLGRMLYPHRELAIVLLVMALIILVSALLFFAISRVAAWAERDWQKLVQRSDISR